MKPSLMQTIKKILYKISQNPEKEVLTAANPPHNPKHMLFSNSLEENISLLYGAMAASDDLVLRSFEVSTEPSIRAAIFYLEGLADVTVIESTILNPLTEGIHGRSEKERRDLYGDLEGLAEKILTNANISLLLDASIATDTLLKGSGILLIDHCPKAISVNISKTPGKEHTEPKFERVVRGPQQGFVEDIHTNVAMLRRRLRSPHFVVKGITLGRSSKTEIRIAYLNNIADPSMVEELENRLKKIHVDEVVGSYPIEEYIQDSPTNLFQTTFYSERPDRVQAMLLEGRIAILCDETPFVIVIPAIFSDFFITTEDYYQNFYFATFNRFLGYLGTFIVTFLPSIYVAVTTFHQEMLPTRLALTIAGTRAGVPYPAFIEALMMEIAFEALREAGIRLPTHMGQAVSIVGALIIGQAAVEAGLVSPVVIIVVAVTAIFSFTIPYNNFSLSLRLYRFINMTLGAVLGIYGIMTGALILALNLISLRSFGVPFMTPFSPMSLGDLKDWFFRFPQWSITKRSSQIIKNNILKKSEDLKPSPPSEGGK